MPNYDYLCDACGPFTALQPMAEFRAERQCPICGTPAPRALLTAPALAVMDGTQRRAHAANERSAAAPRLASASGHGAGCSCCKGNGRRRTAVSKAGGKSFPKSRPWLISH